MSDSEHFLARWSRRKREGGAAESRPAAEELPVAKADAEPRDEAEPAPLVEEPGKPPPPAFDPSVLPPVDSIGAESDITCFLTSQVPAELKRAALRRAWASDPAIRDFAGLQENDWDFTKPESIPGFGGVIAEHDVKELVRRVFGDAPEPAEIQAVSQAQPPATGMEEAAGSARFQEPRGSDGQVNDEILPLAEDPSGQKNETNGSIVQGTNNIAEQPSSAHSPGQYQKRQRQHGGALPRDFTEPNADS